MHPGGGGVCVSAEELKSIDSKQVELLPVKLFTLNITIQVSHRKAGWSWTTSAGCDILAGWKSRR
jgi:hypothetical protein